MWESGIIPKRNDLKKKKRNGITKIFVFKGLLYLGGKVDIQAASCVSSMIICNSSHCLTSQRTLTEILSHLTLTPWVCQCIDKDGLSW
jgi:hypothetical protein